MSGVEALRSKMDMPFLKLLSYFLLLTSFNLASSEVDIPTYNDHNCTINKNFSSDSPYQFNLNNLLLSLYSKAADRTDPIPEFYKTTEVDVYGEYMCRGDVPMEVCRDCVQDATNRIASECPNNKEAIIWYDQCFLRYSDRSFLSTLQQLPVVSEYVPTVVSCNNAKYTSTTCLPSKKTSRFSVRRRGPRRHLARNDYIELNKTTLMNDAVVEAANSTKKFATKEANLTSGVSMYTLVQCTRDLSPQFCSKCLSGLIELIPTDSSIIGGRIQNPSCNLRFQEDRFYYKGDQPPDDDIFQESESPRLVHWNCSTTKANYTVNDPYVDNLGNLFEDLNKASNITKNHGFYRTMVGNKSNTVYGLFMCRGDVSLQLCNECVNEGIEQLNDTCSSSKEAIIWYDMCMLRYSNRSFFSTLDTQPIQTKRGADMLQNEKVGFNRLLANTLSDLVTATLNSTPIRAKNFATTKEFSSSEFRTLYTLAQCTPNLNSQDCQKCLLDARQQISSCCLGKRGGQVMNPSCNLSGVPVIPGKNKDHSRTIIIAVSLSVVSITFFCFGGYYWKRKKNQLSHKAILEKNFGSGGATLESLQFNFATIEAATNKFSIENRIGKGGFGEVYMGVLPDGHKIAVKRLSENSSQGLIEFKNEVLLIAKLQHRNLVALIGFCLKDQEKILVYEYVPNKSLDYFLFGLQKPRELNWPERYKIIEGIARGIHYLHEHSRLKVIHRDLKPSNILLDDEMNPKISDFGMARMVGINETRGSTNRIVGTLGYMSPEYVKFGLFSEKSDVFSFGVIVLEIISGKNINSHGESHESQYGGGLLSDAWKHWRGENLIAILDSNLTETGSHSEIMRCIHIGLLCGQGNPQVRPSMNKVVKCLSNDSMKLPIPHEPAFFLHSQMEAAETSRAMEAQLANHDQYSINEISESVLFPR
ncbi:hypothetical protein K1719_004731 [Acacia pycnantha]|nr:hypothetical protein K1719_004731 [Acacia pycnantha]